MLGSVLETWLLKKALCAPSLILIGLGGPGMGDTDEKHPRLLEVFSVVAKCSFSSSLCVLQAENIYNDEDPEGSVDPEGQGS